MMTIHSSKGLEFDYVYIVGLERGLFPIERLFEDENIEVSTSVSIELYDAEIASQWVNDFIKFIDVETIRQLGENIRNSIANRIRDIESAIGSKRQMVKQRR